MVTIRAHHDADGITAAYFTTYGIGKSKIEIWNGKFGDTTGLKEGDYMVDMRPIQNMEKIHVIDHHLPHREDRKYDLISDEVPASLIAWKLYKEKIPKSEWWKLAIGLVGDGQPELIPTEIFKECPQLLTKIKTSTYLNYGKWKIGYYPSYKLLSSYVNAFLRIGKFDDALSLITYSQNPINLIHTKTAISAKIEVKKNFEDIVKTCDSYSFEDLAIFIFASPYRMSGYVASSLQDSVEGKTVMAINRKDGSGSLRGDLAYYWRDKLKHLDYLQIDGHPGFCGLTITCNPDALVEDILKMT